MDKKERTALARRVGRMTREQVRPLLDEVEKQREKRRGCPDCHYDRGPNWHHCEEYESFCDANKGRILQVYQQLRAHEKACENCYIESYWKEFESYCEKCEELSDLFELYWHRLDHLAFKKACKAFEQANGRVHANILELVTWGYDTGYEREY